MVRCRDKAATLQVAQIDHLAQEVAVKALQTVQKLLEVSVIEINVTSKCLDIQLTVITGVLKL